jgi:hypothetical protein
VASLTKSALLPQFGSKRMCRGGGPKIFARKIIYRKMNLHKNHMLTCFKAKQGRWVDEGGEPELDSEIL